MKTRELKNELKSLSDQELSERRVAVAEELLKRRFQAAVGQGQPGSSVVALRRQLARVETEARGRRIKAIVLS